MNFVERSKWIRENVREWKLLNAGEYDHSAPLEYDYCHFESTFVANEVRKHYTGTTILDIGCYYHFVLGLCGSFESVTSIDCRPYGGPTPENLTSIACDAKKLPFPDDSFSMIASQCTLEHIGLGMYGDAFDWGADRVAVQEMRRVLQPGGSLILTTTLANTAKPVVMYNCHRIYNFSTIRQYFEGMELCCEAFFNITTKKTIDRDEVTTTDGLFDVYGSCWRKASI